MLQSMGLQKLDMTWQLNNNKTQTCIDMGFPGGSMSKESACNAKDLGTILVSGRSPGEGNGYLLQYSCLENHMGKEVWWATVHSVPKSRTQMSH